jgi:hypothetical protein
VGPIAVQPLELPLFVARIARHQSYDSWEKGKNIPALREVADSRNVVDFECVVELAHLCRIAPIQLFGGELAIVFHLAG